MNIQVMQCDDESVSLRNRSQLTGNVNEMTLPLSLEQYDAGLQQWLNGKLVQEAFPTLNAEQREFLLTGATQAEWDAAFPAEDE